MHPCWVATGRVVVYFAGLATRLVQESNVSTVVFIEYVSYNFRSNVVNTYLGLLKRGI